MQRKSSVDAEDALNRRSLPAKEPLIIGLFFGKRPIKRGFLRARISGKEWRRYRGRAEMQRPELT